MPRRSSTGRPGSGCTDRPRASRARSSTAGTTDPGGATAPMPRPASGRRPTSRTGRSSTSTRRPIVRPRSLPPSPTTGTTSRSSPWPRAGVGEHRPPAPSWKRSGLVGGRASGCGCPCLAGRLGLPALGSRPARGRVAFLALGRELRRDDGPRRAARPVAADPPLWRGLLAPRRLGRGGDGVSDDHRRPAPRVSLGAVGLPTTSPRDSAGA